MSWMEQAAHYDEETKRLLQIAVDFLVQYFGYEEETADELMANFLSGDGTTSWDEDLFHHEGAYRTAALAHYLQGLNGDPSKFTDWLAEHGHKKAPFEARRYFIRHYYKK